MNDAQVNHPFPEPEGTTVAYFPPEPWPDPGPDPLLVAAESGYSHAAHSPEHAALLAAHFVWKARMLGPAWIIQRPLSEPVALGLDYVPSFHGSYISGFTIYAYAPPCEVEIFLHEQAVPPDALPWLEMLLRRWQSDEPDTPLTDDDLKPTESGHNRTENFFRWSNYKFLGEVLQNLLRIGKETQAAGERQPSLFEPPPGGSLDTREDTSAPSATFRESDLTDTLASCSPVFRTNGSLGLDMSNDSLWRSLTIDNNGSRGVYRGKGSDAIARYDLRAPFANTEGECAANEVLLRQEIEDMRATEPGTIIWQEMAVRMADSYSDASPILRVSLTQLLKQCGKQELSRVERERFARELDATFRALSQWETVYETTWINPRTRRPSKISGHAPLVSYEGHFYATGTPPADAFYSEDLGFTFAPTTWTQIFREHRDFMQSFGYYDWILRIGTDTSTGELARRIAMTLLDLGRTNVAQGGHIVTIKRKTILNRLPPTSKITMLVEGKNPQRAREAFSEACERLKRADPKFGLLVAHVIDPANTRERSATGRPAKNWRTEWENDDLTFTLAGPLAEKATELRRLARGHADTRQRTTAPAKPK